MQVTALAEVVLEARRADGGISLPDIERRLSRAGLDELARAASSLARRLVDPRKTTADPREHPWF